MTGWFKKAWRLFRWLSLYVAVIFVLIAISEVHQLYGELYSTHPVLGWFFLLAVLLPLVLLTWQLVAIWITVPTAIKPPQKELFEKNAKLYARKCVGYTRLLAEMLSRNENLTPEDCQCLSRLAHEVRGFVENGSSFSPDALDEMWTQKTHHIIDKLDVLADKEVNRSALVAGVGAAVSQNSAIDGIIQIYQMTELTVKIVKVYWCKPALVPALSLGKDIVVSAGSIIAVSQLSNSKLFQGILNKAAKLAEGIPLLPGIIKLSDDAVQGGLSYALVRRYAGSVKRRCWALQWDVRTERDRIRRAVREEKEESSIDQVKEERDALVGLMKRFSWAGESQSPQAAVCLIDHIKEAYSDPSEISEHILSIRAQPSRSWLSKVSRRSLGSEYKDLLKSEAMQVFRAYVKTVEEQQGSLTNAQLDFLNELEEDQAE